MTIDTRPIEILVPYIIDGGTGKRSALLGRYLEKHLGRKVNVVMASPFTGRYSAAPL